MGGGGSRDGAVSAPGASGRGVRARGSALLSSSVLRGLGLFSPLFSPFIHFPPFISFIFPILLFPCFPSSLPLGMRGSGAGAARSKMRGGAC